MMILDRKQKSKQLPDILGQQIVGQETGSSPCVVTTTYDNQIELTSTRKNRSAELMDCLMKGVSKKSFDDGKANAYID